MKVLIFGASGPVGCVVTRMALERNYSVRLFVRDKNKAEKSLGLNGDGDSQSSVEIIEGDLGQLWSAINTGEGCDAIISCVPLAFAPSIIKVAKWNRIKRIVLFSSTRLFSKVECPSVRMVERGEKIVENCGLDWTLLRPTMVVDYPNDQNVSKLARLIKKMPVVPIPGNGKQLVQPVHVGDCAKATLDCLERQESIGKSLTLAGGEVLTYREMLNRISEKVGMKRVLISIPLFPFQVLQKIFPFIFKKVGIEKAMIDRMGEDKAFSIEETKQVLDYEPLRFDEMMEK